MWGMLRVFGEKQMSTTIPDNFMDFIEKPYRYYTCYSYARWTTPSLAHMV